MHGPGSAADLVSEETVLAEPVVVPAEMVGNRIEADPFDRNSAGPAAADLGGDRPQPVGPALALGAGLGDDDRPAEACEDLEEQVRKRPVQRVPGADGWAAVDPLVGRVVVQPQDVEEARIAADLRPQPSRKQLEGLVLGIVPALGLAARAAAGGIVVDRDQRFAVDETRAGIRRAQFMHRRQRGAGELDLELEAAAPRQRG